MHEAGLLAAAIADALAAPEPDEADHPFSEACGWPPLDTGGHQVEAAVRWSAA
jgi:hypothetical protein